MSKLWLVLLLSCCLCGAEGNRPDPNPRRISCLYENFNSSVTYSSLFTGLWHIVKAITIIGSSAVPARTPHYSLTINVAPFGRDPSGPQPAFYAGIGGSYYLVGHRHIDRKTSANATVYPLFLEPSSTAVVWFRYDSRYPDVNLMFVLSRFHNETRHMNKVDKTLRAFCPDVGAAVGWYAFPTVPLAQTYRYNENEFTNCTDKRGW